jgi:hypothetical protein
MSRITEIAEYIIETANEEGDLLEALKREWDITY